MIPENYEEIVLEIHKAARLHEESGGTLGRYLSDVYSKELRKA